jgi:hypothetical protein
MGDIRQPVPVLLIVAVFSRHDTALQWARHRCEREWGPAALTSLNFDFRETNFYRATMGEEILKHFLAFQDLIDPGRLVDLKHQTNEWEEEFRVSHPEFNEPRPLNLDPGYLTEAKLVLATTKDRDHRIYLNRGIFAEVTLYFQGGQWQSRPWTYPDYRRADYHQFFARCREYLRQRYGRDALPTRDG